MDIRSRWQEAAILLGAGAQMMPLGDNKAEFRWIHKELECLQKAGRVGHWDCDDSGLRYDLIRDS